MARKRPTSPKNKLGASPSRVPFRTGILLVGGGFVLGVAAAVALVGHPRENVAALVAERLSAAAVTARHAVAFRAAPLPVRIPETRLPAVPRTAAPGRPRVAIVLDDWGYNLDAFPQLEGLRRPVTLSVLPDLAYSARIAEDGHRWGHEIILHMPMEPKGNVPLEKSTIRTAMTDAEIRDRLNHSIEGLPHLVGISNHQGSKATEDGRVMKTVLAVAKSRSLFFLDSVTTDRSSVPEAARSLGMPVLRRDVFLDNTKTEEAIQARFDELRRVAKTQGWAVGIGHDEPLTVEMIKKNIPQFEAEGIEIVRLSDLLKEREKP